jgi:myo-inositol-1(or 4)-monophosphatase
MLVSPGHSRVDTTLSKRGLERRFLAACAVAREAGDLARRHFESRDLRDGYKLKGAQDYWTAADGEIERLIVSRLSEAFPDDTFFGEEGGGSFSPQVWVIDPIDGTANFARGIAHFCISIAFMREGTMAIGAIYDPVKGELFAARREHGATCNGRPMRVSTIDDLNHATIEVGWSTRRPMKDYIRLMDQVTSAGAGFRRAGSGALGIAYVADGRCEGYCELHINSWDALAALLMVTEAGGWTNDFLAYDGLVQGNPVLATTPALKDSLIAATPALGLKY